MWMGAPQDRRRQETQVGGSASEIRKLPIRIVRLTRGCHDCALAELSGVPAAPEGRDLGIDQVMDKLTTGGTSSN
jgi:hypothetical protein